MIQYLRRPPLSKIFADGLLWPETGSISVPSLPAKARLTRNSFSIYLKDNGSGRILFGDQGHVSQQRYTPFFHVNGKFVSYFVAVERFCVGSFCLKETEFEALINARTSFTLLPAGVYDKAVMKFDKQAHATRIYSQSYPFDFCYNVNSHKSINIPPMKLNFSKNQSIIIQNPIVSISQIFADGLLGLGTGSISVPSLLAKARLIRNSFSICLKDNGSGRIWQSRTCLSTTIYSILACKREIRFLFRCGRGCVLSFYLKETEFEALIDTKTSFTLLPKGVYDKVVAEFDKQEHATRIYSQSYPFDFCYNVKLDAE